MRGITSVLAVAGLLLAAGCEEEKKAGEAGKTTETAAGTKTGEEKPAEGAQTGDAAKLSEDVGVEPGAIAPEESEGGAAVLTAIEGTVEVRRTGTETWEAAKADDELREGDQVRTGSTAKATITLVDETTIEVAEESAVAIGSRDATEDPASSAAVLYGIGRFTVADRAEGEGPFMVYTSAGVIATKGTVYTVGVLASGETRVGVETGEVEVAGAAKLDAPVAVASGKAIVIGTVELGKVEALGTVDWGTWRDEHEAKVEAEAAAKFHAERAAALEAELKASYDALEVQTQAAAEAEAKAVAAADANDVKAYEAAAPEAGGAVDASFALSMRLQFLTYAMLGHAYVVDSLYVRNPSVVAVIEPVRPRLAASVLWHKKYHVVTHAHIAPLRPIYYVHHPVGRVRAKFVAHEIPPFYAKVKLTYKAPEVRTRVQFPVFRLPVIRAKANIKRTVWVTAPKVGWYVGVKGRVRPAAFKGTWYVRPAAPKAKILFGGKATGQVKTVFAVVPPRPRAQAVVRFKGGLGVRDHGAGMGAAGAGKIKAGVDAPGIKVRDHRDKVEGAAAGGVDVGIKVKGGVDGAAGAGAGAAVDVRDKVEGSVGGAVGGAGVQVRDHRDKAGVTIKGGVGAGAASGVKMKGALGGSVKAGAGGAVKVKEKAPEKPKVEAPKAKGEVKGSVKVKGGLKIGD